MRAMQKRLTALLLAAVLTGAPGGLIPRAAAEEAEDTGRMRVSAGVHSTVVGVLGVSFLCAGGMVVLIMFKDKT